jgi:hypothetical protein
MATISFFRSALEVASATAICRVHAAAGTHGGARHHVHAAAQQHAAHPELSTTMSVAASRAAAPPQ